MKKIAITQRVDLFTERNERRDALDQKYYDLLCTCGFLPIIIPNRPNILQDYLNEFDIDGILLTGGNDLPYLGGDVPERDEVEKELITYSINMNIPVLGICRGMQIIQDYFGSKLQKYEGHINVREQISCRGEIVEVNSYHNYSTKEDNPVLLTWARAQDGVIKAVSHKKYNIHGIMWHPERENPFKDSDIRLIKDIFDHKS